MAPPRENRFANLSPQKTSTPTRTGSNFAMAQGKGSMPTKEATRRVFFNNRPDISDDRLRRRQAQADELKDFKADPTKTKAVNIVDPVTGKVTGTVTGLTQAATAGGKTVAQREQELALKYGPTFSEIASDVSYAGGKVIGALGERAMSGSLGIFGIIKEVANYATDKASNAYNNLTDVQKEIANNPNRYTFAAQQEKIRQLKNFRDLESQAEKDALGLRLDALQEASAQDASGIPAIGGGGGFDEQPSDLFGRGSLPEPQITIDTNASDPDLTQKQLNLAEGIGFLDPRYIEQQKALLDELNLSPQVAGLLKPNAPGGEENNQGQFMFPQGYTIPGTDITIPSIMKQGEEDTTGGEGFLPDDFIREEDGTMRLNFDDQASVTKYNNPVNLMDVGQAGATGETYGKGFAVFPDAQTGIRAAKNDLAIKTERYGGNVDEIIGEFSPRSDNPDSFDNYVNFVKQGVGDTVDPGEEDELLRRVIQFENKPDIAQQYLAMVAEGGLMDKKMYGGIISSK